MKLSNDTIRSITFGAVRIEEKADGLHFYKCTPKQIEAWSQFNDTLGAWSANSTGVRLDFHTDSPWMTFNAAKGNKFEVLINDLAVARIEFDPLRQSGITPKIELGEGEKRVTLVFPSHQEGGVLTEVELADGSTVTPHQHKEKILFIGDSITQGWNSHFDSNSYAWRVTRHFDADSIIDGIGGAFYAASTFDRPDFEPNKVIIAYGTNDFGHFKTQEELRQQMGAYLDLISAHYPKAKVYCIAPIFRFDLAKERKMGSWPECRALIQQEIAKRGFQLIDGYDLVPHLDYFFADAVHPNDIGFAEYAKNLIKNLEK
ncbi:MAG: SGNH/GDSL hydrolase family protein [Clostridia bacterium]|nr:SGNH/GDSL hydrolase family protein [Clostridia bacterium]